MELTKRWHSMDPLWIPEDCSFVLDAVTSGRLSLQAAGVETTTAEVTMTICILSSPAARCFLPLCFVCYVIFSMFSSTKL